MYVNKHPPPLIHTYTYRHSVLYPHTHKMHMLETTSLQFPPLDTITLHHYKNQTQYTLFLAPKDVTTTDLGDCGPITCINPNKQILGPPSYSCKKFRDPPFSPPSPILPSNLNSDWSLRSIKTPHEKSFQSIYD